MTSSSLPPVSAAVPEDRGSIKTSPDTVSWQGPGSSFGDVLEQCASEPSPASPSSGPADEPAYPSVSGRKIRAAATALLEVGVSAAMPPGRPLRLQATLSSEGSVITAVEDFGVSAPEAAEIPPTVASPFATVAAMDEAIIALGLAMQPPPPQPVPDVVLFQARGQAPSFSPATVPALADEPKVGAPFVVGTEETAPVAGEPLPGSVSPSRAPGPVVAAPGAVSAQPVEKLAGPSAPRGETVPVAVESGAADKFLNVGDRRLANASAPLGIEAAKPTAKMSARAETTSPASRPADAVASGALSPAAVAPAAWVEQGGFSTRDGERPTEIRGQAVDAAGAVKEIAELTHELRSRGRSSVEVRFNFQDNTDLSVRIVCRGGEVQTTFRSDSPGLRAALGEEWQAQAASGQRGHPLPDPVFRASSEGQGSSASTAEGDARQRSFSQGQDASRQAEKTSGTFRLSPGSGASVPVRAAVSHRPETVRHLHVFA